MEHPPGTDSPENILANQQYRSDHIRIVVAAAGILGLLGITGLILGLAGLGVLNGTSSLILGAITASYGIVLTLLLARNHRIRVRARCIADRIGCHSESSPGEILSELDRELARLNRIDRDHHLIRLMKDHSPDYKAILEELSRYHVVFPENGFILLALNDCRRQSLCPPCNHLVRDIRVCTQLESDLPGRYSSYVLDLEDLYICMFNVPYPRDENEAKNIKKGVEEYALVAMQSLLENFDVQTMASISEIHSGVDSLVTALEEVQGLFEYRNITGNSAPVIHYTDYYVSFDSWYEFGNTYHKFDEVRQLITSIQVGDFTNAKSLINELIENDYSTLFPSLLLARCRLFGIIDAAINAMGLLKEELDAQFLKELDPTTRIVNCRSYSELQEQMNMILDAIITYYSRIKKDQPPEWFETIKAYIDKHYNDIDINVASIADHFNISAAYYARVFKKYTGMSPLDYIHKLRMRSAKRLMSKGVSVKDAANIVGYGSPITMSRAFKRYEGVTPGNYVKR